MRTPIITTLRAYMLACPLLADLKKLNIDYLGTAGPGEYSIDTVPTNPIVKKYADGGAIKQYTFVFASKEFYGDDPLEQLDSLGFYENLQEWFEEMTNKNTLPELDDGRTSISLETLTSGYIFDSSEIGKARYQIQARLKYLED